MRRALLLLVVASATACGKSGAPGVRADAGADARAPASDAAVSCADLPAAYRAALLTAQACDPDAGGQCSIGVRLDLLCGCATYVNDPTLPHDLNAEWQAQNCATSPSYSTMGCVTGCRVEAPRTCVAVDGGGGICHEPGDPP
jgi:hypothetical protein